MLRQGQVKGIGGGRGNQSGDRVAVDHPDRNLQKRDYHPNDFGGPAQTQEHHSSRHARSVSVERNTTSGCAVSTPSGMASVRQDARETKMERSSTRPADPYATVSTKWPVARTSPRATFTSAPVVETPPMALKNAVSQRRHSPRTPLKAQQWEEALRSAHLLSTYYLIPDFILHGAYAGIPNITHTYTPLNKDSTETLSLVFNDIIQAEFNKGRYLGPFSRNELEQEIGPFQSSPLSLVPKPGKPGKYRLIQDLSHPHTNSPIASINSHLNSDDFPCTWGTFRTVCTLIRNLPSGSQAAVRDIAEAYRIIPLHESQWAGVVVRISNNPERFALNTSNCFGCTTAGGLFGMFSDALADLLRARGIGPILKWVDDFIFIRIPQDKIQKYNETRDRNREIVTSNGGRLQTGGRIWYKGKSLPDVGAEHFAEDLSFPIRQIHTSCSNNTAYPYDMGEIDAVTAPLGIPWEASKDIPFNQIVPFIGLTWDLENKTVSLSEAKKEKYLQAISEWRQRTAHTLDETRKLYGKLLYACLIIPQGRAYLIHLEKMIGTFNGRSFVPHRPPKHLAEDLVWWARSLAHPSLSREIPGGRQIIDVRGFSDASSTVGIGVVIGNRWRAWRLLPGWKAGSRDIGWAEAVGMELLVRIVLSINPYPGIQIFGDNTGVVEGWWTGRSRNSETNKVFRRIHEVLADCNTVLTTRYVSSGQNPADDPSRGIYPPRKFLLPSIALPIEISPFLVDFDAPCHPRERDTSQGLPPMPKEVLSTREQHRRQEANILAYDLHDETPQTPPAN